MVRTAAMFFYGLNRFSVDLDFDLLDIHKLEVVKEKIQQIIPKFGKIKHQADKRNSVIFVLSYRELDHNIKIEINKQVYGSEYEIKNYFGLSMLVMKKEDMFANKLVAMYERLGKANRDVFDVYFFARNNWQINSGIIEKRTNMSISAFLKILTHNLEKIDNKYILNGLGEVLDDSQKSWARDHLKKDVLFNLRLLVEKYSKSIY
jgi:predicted nucleotidyltransferase component of viral defense system